MLQSISFLTKSRISFLSKLLMMFHDDFYQQKFLEKKLDEVLMELGKVRLQLRSNEME